MIQSVRLQNYRSHADYVVEFDPKVNIIVGANGSGKTSVLEAIYTILQGTSFKTSDTNTVKSDQDWARIDLNKGNEAVTLKIKKSDEKIDKEFSVNSNKYKRLPQKNRYPVVLFEPEMLKIISGSPTNRRDYLDKIISIIDPNYKKHLSRYKKALIQRNKLLKMQAADEHFFSWNIQLAENGSQIIKQRQKYCKQLNDQLEDIYNSIAATKSSIDLQYTPYKEDVQQQLINHLENNISHDRASKSTLFGPHRDDLEVSIDGRTANTSASRGECRSIVLGIKIIEIDQLKKHYNKPPLLLFDDVFSELDGARRKTLTKVLDNHQVIITTTDADTAIGFSKEAKLIPINR